MRRGSALLLGVLVALLAAASARATGVTTTGTTTTTTTTKTTTPSYAPLSLSSLPAGCVGAGAAALLPPAHPVITLGTPAGNLGPSAYPSSGSVLSFGSAASTGSTCGSATVTLSSVSLFGGVVTASSVQATDGRGTAAGVEIDGAPVTAGAGTTVHVEGWGQLTFGAKVGRVTAPLVLRLLQAHGSLPAGTAIAVAFAASAKPVAAPEPEHAKTGTHANRAAGSSGSRAHPSGTQRATKHKQPQRPPPDYPASAFPFLLKGGLAPAVRDNGVVSTAMQYLGVPYQWGGASPKAGFDCSGLVTYVFGKLGVALPHFAAAQYYSPGAVWVSPERLQPGDLVFFTGSDGTRKEPGHVGIYVDDGYFIDAPHTGSFVRIDSLSEHWYANQYVAAKRIVGGSSLQRHLLHASKDAASVPADPLFPQRTTGLFAGEPLPAIAAVQTAARTSAVQSYGLWAGVGLAGLLVLSLGGTLTYRRRSGWRESNPRS